MLAALIGLLALGGLAWGTTHYVRSRLSARLQPRRERHRRIGLGVVSVSGFALLVPDLLAGLVVAGTGGSGALATVGWLFYRLFALGAIGIAALVMWATSDPVTGRMRRGRDMVVASVPFGPGRDARRMRRRLGAFPQEWNALLEHDQGLTRRLLRYQRDADAAASRPTMADLTHPLTRAAVDAMFECDAVRTTQPPAHVHDVLATDYGRAVARFDEALRAAEEYASAHVVSSVTDAEQRVVADAARTLSFLQTNATTPQERARAYSSISERLARAEVTQATEAQAGMTKPMATSSHPWLTVEDRAEIERD
jgi:hypothetical protein